MSKAVGKRGTHTEEKKLALFSVFCVISEMEEGEVRSNLFHNRLPIRYCSF